MLKPYLLSRGVVKPLGAAEQKFRDGNRTPSKSPYAQLLGYSHHSKVVRGSLLLETLEVSHCPAPTEQEANTFCLQSKALQGLVLLFRFLSHGP